MQMRGSTPLAKTASPAGETARANTSARWLKAHSRVPNCASQKDTLPELSPLAMVPSGRTATAQTHTSCDPGMDHRAFMLLAREQNGASGCTGQHMQEDAHRQDVDSNNSAMGAASLQCVSSQCTDSEAHEHCHVHAAKVHGSSTGTCNFETGCIAESLTHYNVQHFLARPDVPGMHCSSRGARHKNLS